MDNTHEIIIFYRYTKITDPALFVAWQKLTGAELGLTGRILIAHEGINGTLEGTKDHILEYERRMHLQDGGEGTFGDFADLWFKHSPGTGSAFPKLKVKVRDEIVTLGLGEEDLDPNEVTGTHLTPEELKQWIESGEEFEIIDMRNDYEYKVGHFRGSINPMLENFRDLSKVTPALEALKEKKVLTVCTYGVRCEKASGYLKNKGFKDVYQLDGGIGTYMKAFPGEDFLGSLYVFDNRITERFTDDYEVVGVCENCKEKSEHYSNCAFDDCHKKMIVCESCLSRLGEMWCGEECREASTHLSRSRS
ncbi:MAG: hypothetical protein A2494_01895 [Candidatus Lloydbacteria bacterium RIFOXYC12_FULL_46_25]|uniref:tRNA uridine(34) hydroxylase n=1 Tax=Candidatus Lloydbacteria bacterium RIFOXYC12_FULL_46_25 TaxID=1798670 RepID=A0A1G2DWL9_9BACT|nr:MAG: hypothetical protein A2494_01895 [Candidatus Lloydbacteria bacterium RIFOXYC12_FULL_46_25]